MQEIVTSVSLKGKCLAGLKNGINVKQTTNLSNSIEIHRRMGTETLLSQKDYNKLAAIKKLTEEKKAKIEFKEMVQQHNRNRKDASMNKSKLSSKSKTMNQSTLSTRSVKKPAKKSSQEIIHTQVKPLKNSNKYLYTKLCSEIDEHIKRILAENPNAEILAQDNIRIVLVKSGFIGHNVDNKDEILSDEKCLKEIWKILKGEENGRISPQNLKMICGIIQGVISPLAKRSELNTYMNSASGSQPQTSQIGFLNSSGHFVLKNNQDQKKIIKKFARL